MLDLPLGPKRARPATLRKRPTTAQAVAQERQATAEKTVAVPEVELEPEQDTAVVDDPQSLPEQAKKRRSDISVVSDARHPPANIKGRYHIMKYGSHGKDGTYAVRLKDGPQFTEINMPNATLLQNQEVAEAICAELNKGVKPDTVRELMSVLKEAMCKKISKA